MGNVTVRYPAGWAWGWSSRNILDNWYFADPIDQRQGCIIPGGTTIYRDSGFTDLIGPAAVTCEVVEKTAAYVKVRDPAYPQSFYYAVPSAAIRGYCGVTHTIDRWIMDIDGGSGIELTGRGIRIKSGGTYWGQRIDRLERFEGITWTFSVLTSDNVLYAGTVDHVHFEVNVPQFFFRIPGSLYAYINKINDHGPNVAQVECAFDTGMELVAAQLEPGPYQTLAHKEGDTWVLNNPPPNRALELLKCQRYQVVLKQRDQSLGYSNLFFGTATLDGLGADNKYSGQGYIVLPTPMRIVPTISAGTLRFYNTIYNIQVESVYGVASQSGATFRFNFVTQERWDSLPAEIPEHTGIIWTDTDVILDANL